MSAICVHRPHRVVATTAKAMPFVSRGALFLLFAVFPTINQGVPRREFLPRSLQERALVGGGE
jgi:hypothetical protein